MITFPRGGGHCVQQTNDGGYIVAGTTADSDLVKTDSLGNTDWERALSGTGSVFAHSVQQSGDGDYVAAGGGELEEDAPMGVVLAKTNGKGEVRWQRLVSDSGERRDIGFSVVQARDGGFVVAGVRVLTRDSGLLLIKTDSLGGRQWEKRYAVPYGKYSPDDPVQVRLTSDGGYIIATKTLLRVDSLGNRQWLRTFSGTTGAYSAIQTSDGGYVATGPADGPHGRSKGTIFLLKTDAQGDQQWMRKYAASKFSTGDWVEQTNDGGYIIAGMTHYRACIIRTDSIGSGIWSDTRFLGGAECVRQTADHGYICTGYYYDESRKAQFLYLLKFAREQ